MCIAIIIHKGSVVPSDIIFKRCFKKNPDETHIVHFRKKSSGGMAMEFTHPFPITTNINELHKLEGNLDVGVLFHNGTIKTLEKNHLLSDSQELAIMLAKKSILKKDEVGISRVAVLFPNGKVSKLGTWIKEDFGTDLNPCFFSNDGYKTPI